MTLYSPNDNLNNHALQLIKNPPAAFDNFDSLSLFQNGTINPLLRIDADREGMVFTFRKADPKAIRELLQFMISKNWLLPTDEIYEYLEEGENNNAAFNFWKEPKEINSFASPHNFLQPKNNFLISVNKAIEEHLDDECFRSEQLSQKIFLCKMQLHRKLKKLANLSPANYIRKYRVLRSKYFLKNRELTISQVSLRVGFKSLEYFSRSFKEEFDTSPSAFRKMWD